MNLGREALERAVSDGLREAQFYAHANEASRPAPEDEALFRRAQAAGAIHIAPAGGLRIGGGDV